jgi:Na+-transporting NADH:ubiquinone oxidoreductase subunit A
VKVTVGTCVSTLLEGKLSEGNNRVISGNVLTGDKIAANGYLGFYHHQITVIPEGDEPLFFLTDGWLAPGLKEFSLSHAFPTWIMPKAKKFKLTTNQHGEDRAFVVTGQYEKVFPFDIYPVQLVKSIIVNDIDAMEKLGIYEVAPEDFALCEYSCTSKINVQSIVRQGLDVIKEEC